MKRPGEDEEPNGGRAEKRRRQFEDSRGLEGRRGLPLEEEEETPEQAEDEQEPDEEGTP